MSAYLQYVFVKSPKAITNCTFKISAESVSQLKCDGQVFRLTPCLSVCSSCDGHEDEPQSSPNYKIQKQKTAFYVTIITFI